MTGVGAEVGLLGVGIDVGSGVLVIQRAERLSYSQIVSFNMHCFLNSFQLRMSFRLSQTNIVGGIGENVGDKVRVSQRRARLS